MKYLEARLIEVAKEREHYQLNQNSEKPPRMSESERATMEQFLENIVFLVDVLGHKIFEDSAAPVSAEGEQILFVTKAKVRGCDAKGYPTWNFNKYLVDREGNVVEHFSSNVTPDDVRLRGMIDDLL